MTGCVKPLRRACVTGFWGDEVRYRIGRALADRLEPDDDDGLLAAVSHMNAAIHILEDPSECAELCALNLRAAKRAMRATAYSTATTVLTAASSLLASDAWSSSPALKFAVERQWVLCDYLSDRQKEAGRRFQELLARVEPVVQAELYARWVELATLRGHFAEALAAARAGLALVGVELPETATPASVGAEYGAIMRLLGGRAPMELAEAPAMTDPVKTAAAELLTTMASPAYFSDPTLMSVALMRLTAMSIEHGICAPSAGGFAGYGLVLAGAFGNYAGGYAFGELAHAILPRFEDQRFASRVKMIMGTYMAPWVRSYGEAQTWLREAIEAGLAYSDPRYGAYAATTLSVITMLEGGPLEAREAQALESIELARLRRDQDMCGIVECHIRYCRTLRDAATRHGLGLGDEDEDGREFAAGLSDRVTPIAAFYLWFYRAQLRYAWGETALGAGDAGAGGRRRATDLRRRVERRAVSI